MAVDGNVELGVNVNLRVDTKTLEDNVINSQIQRIFDLGGDEAAQAFLNAFRSAFADGGTQQQATNWANAYLAQFQAGFSGADALRIPVNEQTMAQLRDSIRELQRELQTFRFPDGVAMGVTDLVNANQQLGEAQLQMQRYQQAYQALLSIQANVEPIHLEGRNLADQLTEINTQISQTQSEIAQLNATPVNMLSQSEIAQLSTRLDELQSKLKQLQTYKTLDSLVLAAVNIDKAIANATVSVVKFGASLAKLSFSALQTGASGVIACVKKLGGAFSSAKQASSSFHKSSGSGFNMGFKQILKYGLGIRSVFMLFRKLRTAALGAYKDIASAFPEVGATFNAFNQGLAQMKGSLGTLIQPLATMLLPVFQSIVAVVTQAANAIAKFFAILGGQNAIYKATAAQKDYTKAAGGSAKATERTVMGFDELNKLQDSSSGGGGGTASGANYEKEKIDLDEIREKFKPIIDAWERLKQAAEPIINKFIAFGQWLLENVLKPVGEWFASSLIPTVLDLITACLKVINDMLENLTPILEWMWTNIIQPIGSWLGSVIIGALQAIAKFIEEHHETIAQVLPIVLAIVGVVYTILNLVPIIKTLIQGIHLILATLGNPIVLIVAAIVGLTALFVELWDNCEGFRQGWTDAFNTMKEAVEKAIGFIKNGDWKGAFGAITEGVKTAAKSIQFAMASAVNHIVDLLNGLSFSIPSWIPVIGGSTFSPNIPHVNVPELAQGAVIPANAPFLAMLGDQKSGTNLEAPESLIRSIIQEEMGNSQSEIASLLEQLISVVGNIQVGDEVIGRAASRYSSSYARMSGR